MKSIKLILASAVICIGLFFAATVNAQECTPDTAPGTGPEWQNTAPGTGPEWQNNAPGTGPEWQGCPPTAQNPATPAPIQPNPFYNLLRLFF